MKNNLARRVGSLQQIMQSSEVWCCCKPKVQLCAVEALCSEVARSVQVLQLLQCTAEVQYHKSVYFVVEYDVIFCCGSVDGTTGRHEFGLNIPAGK